MLHFNNQDGTFSIATQESGIEGITEDYYTTGVCYGDVDNDGLNDLL